jgi:hypothetical protein
MFVLLNKAFNSLFGDNHGSEVEQYIISKNPKNAGDVEYWLQQYTYSTNRNKL